MRNLFTRARSSRVGRAITSFSNRVRERFSRNSAPAAAASSGDS